MYLPCQYPGRPKKENLLVITGVGSGIGTIDVLGSGGTATTLMATKSETDITRTGPNDF